jgi:hypothetical protein
MKASRDSQRERQAVSNIRIGSVTGGTNVIGDHGTISNSPPQAGSTQAGSPAAQSAPDPSPGPPGSPPASLPGHAFISSDPGDELQAGQLQHSLETTGIPVWRDTHSLSPGQDRPTAIRQAITAGTLAFIACFSRASISRNRSHQRHQLGLAIEELRLRDPARSWLIPVRFDNCTIPDLDIGAGRTLASIHPIDLFGRQSEENLARLVTAIQAILDPAARQPPPPAPSPQPPARTSRLTHVAGVPT